VQTSLLSNLRRFHWRETKINSSLWRREQKGRRRRRRLDQKVFYGSHHSESHSTDVLSVSILCLTDYALCTITVARQNMIHEGFGGARCVNYFWIWFYVSDRYPCEHKQTSKKSLALPWGLSLHRGWWLRLPDDYLGFDLSLYVIISRSACCLQGMHMSSLQFLLLLLLLLFLGRGIIFLIFIIIIVIIIIIWYRFHNMLVATKW